MSSDLTQYLKCPMYPFKIPVPGDLVLITFLKIEPKIGVKVTLTEYGGIEGTIYWAQLTRKRRIRSYNKVCPLGQSAVVEVLDVSDDGFIELSKRSITSNDEAICQKNYENSKRLHSLLKKIAVKYKIPLEELCRQTSWNLYEKRREKLAGNNPDEDEVNDIEEDEVNNSETLHPLNIISQKDRFLELSLPSQIQKIFLDEFDNLFGVEKFQLISEVKLVSYQIEGLQDLIREIQGLYKLSEDYKEDGIELQIFLRESPKYSLKITGSDKNKIYELRDKCYTSLTSYKKLGSITYGNESITSFR